jgi:hypothetical protein
MVKGLIYFKANGRSSLAQLSPAASLPPRADSDRAAQQAETGGSTVLCNRSPSRNQGLMWGEHPIGERTAFLYGYGDRNFLNYYAA